MPVARRTLIALIVLFTVTAGGLLFAVIKESFALNSGDRDELVFSTFKAKAEFAAFQHALALTARGGDPSDIERVVLSYDIVYSRTKTLVESHWGDRYYADPKAGSLVDTFRTSVYEMEPLIEALTGGDLGALTRLQERAAPLERVILRLNSASWQLDSKLVTEGRRHLLRLFSMLAGLLVGLVAAVTAFIFMLVHQIRVTDGARAELQTLSQDLLRAKDDAEAANRAKSSFLATMSHELRTPLNAIIGFSQMIHREVLGPVGDARYRQYADDISASGGHLLGLVNGILDLSRIEAGKFELAEDVIDLPAVMAACVEIVKRTPAAAGVEFGGPARLAIPPIWADEKAVRQVLLNVMSNAAKFTPPGGAVYVDARLSGDGAVCVVVRDTGIGMDSVEVDRATEAFAQADSTIAREQEGAGLGLSITQSLMALHGGELLIDSEKGRGTTITLRFPPGRVLAAGANAVANQAEPEPVGNRPVALAS